MCVEYCMHDSDLLSHQLTAQIGRCVDEQRALWKPYRQSATSTVILDIRAGTDITRTTNGRHTNRSTGSEENKFAGLRRTLPGVVLGGAIGQMTSHRNS